MKVEAAHWTEWRVEAKAKWKAEAKICAAILRERKTMKKQRCYVYRTTKKLRSMHSSERIEEMVCELEGYRWDAMLLSGTWRHITNTYSWEQEENTTTNKVLELCWTRSGVKELLTMKWIHQRTGHHRHNRGQPPTHQTDESVFHPLGICGPTRWKNVKTIEKHTTNCKRYIPTCGGGFNAELGLGHGTECISVGRDTLNERNKRGDWMKHWLMLQGYTALNTTYGKTLQKQTTFISPKGNEKQIDNILTKRRYLRNNKDAEANDMIGSDHRFVMATFTIITPKKDGHRKKTTSSIQQNKTEGIKLKRTLEVSEKPELEKRYQEIIEKMKKKKKKKKKRHKKKKKQQRKQKVQKH